MSYKQFDRFAVHMEPLSIRHNKKQIEPDHIPTTAEVPPLTGKAAVLVAELADRMRAARKHDRPRMISFGAHAIKNGLGPGFFTAGRNGLDDSSGDQRRGCYP